MMEKLVVAQSPKPYVQTQRKLRRSVPQFSRAATVECVAPGCLCILGSIATEE